MDYSCITAICGFSGAGKTSIINMIAGLITPDKGIISYNGREFYNSSKKINIPANKRFTGYVFQESRLFPNMKVKKNLLYGEKRKSDASLNCSLDDICSLLGISHLLDRYPQNLSGGEKQKIACGSAAVMEPEIFVFDEPSSNLDVSATRELRELLKILKTQGKTVIIAEHRLYYLHDLADRVLYLKGGAGVLATIMQDEFKQSGAIADNGHEQSC